ncbi:MAG TPA: hypothetical protein VD963_02310 [Phycisphaerales bacterium]|nr:hypothetical protein [Phycisphaerales bacterium]
MTSTRGWSSGRPGTIGRVAGLVVALGAVPALAQSDPGKPPTSPPARTPAPAAPATPTPAAPAPARVETPSPRGTLSKMMRPVTVELKETRLEDVMKFLVEVTGAELEVMWAEGDLAGLDPEQRITLNARNLPALTFLERVLDKAQTDFQQATWQMTDYGPMQVGPKDRLNRTKRLVIYPVQDLLSELPRYEDAPTIDLQSVLQQGEGGGGQSPFTENQTQEQQRRDIEEKVRQIEDLITSLVEPDQWQVNGGDGATIRYFQGNFIVNGPDYVHRQLAGYPYWPEHTTRLVNGRRYVSLSGSAEHGGLDRLVPVPVSGLGGGGSTAKPESAPPRRPGGGGR